MSDSPIASGAPFHVPPAERPRNLVDLLRRSVLRWPDHEAMRWKAAQGVASAAAGARWASWTYLQLWD